jgi:hypothetical protein
MLFKYFHVHNNTSVEHIYVTNTLTCFRLYRNCEKHAPVVVYALSDLCVTSTESADTTESLCQGVGNTLAESEMSMHLIALLGTLLLQDVVHRRYFNGAGNSPSSGFYSSASSGPPAAATGAVEHPVAPHVTILSYEILKTLNTLCR